MASMKKVKRPAETWEEFMKKMPRGRAPMAADIFHRWETLRPGAADSRRPEREPSMVPAEDGEKNAYLAWLTGVMEKEEAHYFQNVILRAEVLVVLAIVPMVQLTSGMVLDLGSQLAIQNKTHLDNAGDLRGEIEILKGRIAELEERGAKKK